MRLALFAASLLALACTVPQYECGHWVPCASGSVQSCTRTDHSLCHYLLSDGTIVECASCDDCSAAEASVITWCAGEALTTPDLAARAPRDMSVAGGDLAHAPADFAHAPLDLWSPPGSDLACYPWGTVCNGDPWCCPRCCAGHCDGSGGCAEQ